MQIPIVINPLSNKRIDVSNYKNDVLSHVDQVMDSKNYRNYFARQKKQNPEKVKNDMICGKLAEFAICDYFNSLNILCNLPDLQIYEKKNKSFNPDLKCSGPLVINDVLLNNSKDIKISCKSFTMEAGKKYGYSAVCNTGTSSHPNNLENALSGIGDHGLDISFKEPKDYIMVVAEVDSNDTVKIFSISNFQYLIEKKLFKEPILDYLKKTKACLYHKDLIDYCKNNG